MIVHLCETFQRFELGVGVVWGDVGVRVDCGGWGLGETHFSENWLANLIKISLFRNTSPFQRTRIVIDNWV